MWMYAAEVRRVVDGDTLDLRIDLGFTVGVDVRVRLLGVDTPEVYGTKRKDPEQYAAGVAASEFVKAWIEGRKVHIRTEKGTGKYGRWLAEIWRDGDPISLNEALVAEGHAERREY